MALPVSSVLKWEKKINIAFPFRPVPTVLCPKAGLNQGHLLKLDLGYAELEEQIKVDSGCSAGPFGYVENLLETKSKTTFR